MPPGVRVAAWHKGERANRRPSHPLNGWEPVIYHDGRQLPGQHRADSIVCGVTPVSTLPGHVIGAKPAVVCRWIFTLLGAGPDDTLDDLFPGSGAVSRAWAAYVSSPAARGGSKPGDPDRGGYPSSEARADVSRTPDRYASRRKAASAADPSRDPVCARSVPVLSGAQVPRDPDRHGDTPPPRPVCYACPPLPLDFAP